MMFRFFSLASTGSINDKNDMLTRILGHLNTLLGDGRQYWEIVLQLSWLYPGVIHITTHNIIYI